MPPLAQGQLARARKSAKCHLRPGPFGRNFPAGGDGLTREKALRINKKFALSGVMLSCDNIFTHLTRVTVATNS